MAYTSTVVAGSAREETAMRGACGNTLVRTGVGLMLLTACAPQHALPPTPAPPTSGAPHGPAAEARTDDVSTFLPPGSQLRLTARGDADGDGDEDVVVVVDSQNGDTQPRMLRLLRRDATGALRPALDSPRAVPCRRCGGMVDDPLQGIVITPATITLRLEGGSRELWSSVFRFDYVHERDDWRLTGVIHGGFDRAGSGRGMERTLASDEIGDVPLTEFEATDFPADALP